MEFLKAKNKCTVFAVSAHMKMLFLGLTTILIFQLSGCLNQYAISPPPPSPQQKAESTVTHYVDSITDIKGYYTSYKFGPLYKTTPLEYKRIDHFVNLKNAELKKEDPNLERLKKYDDSLKRYQALAIKNKSQIKYEIEHIFKLTDTLNVSKIRSFDVTMNRDFKVTSVASKLNLNVSPVEDNLLKNYFTGAPLFHESKTLRNANLLTSRYYEKFGQMLENSQNKTETLKSILDIMKFIQLNNDFKAQDYMVFRASKWINKNYPTFDAKIFKDHTKMKDQQGFELISTIQLSLEESKTIKFIFDLNYQLKSVFDLPQSQ